MSDDHVMDKLLRKNLALAEAEAELRKERGELVALRLRLAEVEDEGRVNSLSWHIALEKVERERDALLADKARLDWLQAHRANAHWGGFITRRGGYQENAVALEWWAPNGDLVSQSERFETLRTAIDAARLASPEGERGAGKSFCVHCAGTGYAPNCTRADRERGDLWACSHCNGAGEEDPA